MKLLLLVAAIGFVQLCSGVNNETKFYEDIDKLKAISGVNQTALDELADKFWQMHLARGESFEVLTYFYCIGNGIDLSKIQSIEFPKIDTMFKEYRDCRYSQTNSCNSEVLFEQIVKTLTKEMNAAEAQLFSTFLLKVISGQNIVTKEEGNQITMKLFTSAFHKGAGVPERNICDMFAVPFDLNINCTKYPNGESEPKTINVTAKE